jgi:hypothetical protein
MCRYSAVPQASCDVKVINVELDFSQSLAAIDRQIEKLEEVRDILG